MQVIETALPGVLRLLPDRFGDGRGHFSETWNAERMRRHGLDLAFVQDNQSVSAAAGTVRGLHYQRPPHAQAKLVRVAVGAILDLAIDWGIDPASAVLSPREAAAPAFAELDRSFVYRPAAARRAATPVTVRPVAHATS